MGTILTFSLPFLCISIEFYMSTTEFFIFNFMSLPSLDTDNNDDGRTVCQQFFFPDSRPRDKNQGQRF